MPPDQYLRRLTFIRYLYSTAVEKSRLPLPMGASALLTLQDAVEMFLLLACEHLNAGKKGQTSFEGYFDLADAELVRQGKSALLGKTSMIRLNKARVNLKHYGNLPNTADLEGFRGSVTSFLEDNTRLVFDVEFAAISMVDLVSAPDAQQSLREAETLMGQGDYVNAIGKIALAYDQVIREYESTKRPHGYRSAFFFGEDFTFLGAFSLGIRDHIFARFVDSVKKTIEAMQSAVRVLSFGLDYRRFARFEALTPQVVHFGGGGVSVVPRMDRTPTEDECRFCFEFVIDAAIRLQETDYEMGNPLSPATAE